MDAISSKTRSSKVWGDGRNRYQLALRGRREFMEYKVLTKEDRRWSGKFSPENLEHTLNSYAADGWRVVSSVPVASMWSISTSQIMILLERETLAS
jgi:hypothetical protein